MLVSILRMATLIVHADTILIHMPYVRMSMPRNAIIIVHADTVLICMAMHAHRHDAHYNNNCACCHGVDIQRQECSSAHAHAHTVSSHVVLI